MFKQFTWFPFVSDLPIMYNKYIDLFGFLVIVYVRKPCLKSPGLNHVTGQNDRLMQVDCTVSDQNTMTADRVRQVIAL